MNLPRELRQAATIMGPSAAQAYRKAADLIDGVTGAYPASAPPTFGDAFPALLSVWVPGRPKTKGSMRVVNGRRGVLTESVDGSKRWRQLVVYRITTQAGVNAKFLLPGPVELGLNFALPIDPVGARAGDIDKLTRNIMDALSACGSAGSGKCAVSCDLHAGVYVDDVQVVTLMVTKQGPVDAPGVHIQVRDLRDPG